MSEEIKVKIVSPDGRRGLWLETDSDTAPTRVTLKAGREGEDASVSLAAGEVLQRQQMHQLVDLMGTVQYAFDSAEDDHTRWAEERDDAKSEAAFATERATVAETERDALIKGLGFEVTGRDGRGSAPIYERGEWRVEVGGYDGWNAAFRGVSVHFEGLGGAVAYAANTQHADNLYAMTTAGLRTEIALDRQRARADAAEKKLDALVEAWDGLCAANAAWSPLGPQACRDAVPAARARLHDAIRAARGEP